jgi:hypothetical protein
MKSVMVVTLGLLVASVPTTARRPVAHGKPSLSELDASGICARLIHSPCVPAPLGSVGREDLIGNLESEEDEDDPVEPLDAIVPVQGPYSGSMMIGSLLASPASQQRGDLRPGHVSPIRC